MNYFNQLFSKLISTAWSKPVEKKIVKLIFDNKSNIEADEVKGKTFISKLIEKNKQLIISNCGDEFKKLINDITEKEILSEEVKKAISIIETVSKRISFIEK